MQTNNHKISDYNAMLNAQYGEKGSAKRTKFDDDAYYISQVLLEARKNARLTQEDLAKRIGADKSYVSRIERGVTIPRVTTFYRIVNALGLTINISPIV